LTEVYTSQTLGMQELYGDYAEDFYQSWGI
jgi:hypothetical protein